MLKNNDFKVLNREVIAESPIFTVERQTIATPYRKTITRDLVVHQPAVAMLVCDCHKSARNPQVLLTREYRVGAASLATALPAGLQDGNEAVATTVARELREECGVTGIANIAEPLSLRVSEGFTNEVVHLAIVTLADDFIEAPEQRAFDQDEYVEHEWVDFETAYDLVCQGVIQSAHSVAAILYFANQRPAD